MQTVLFVSQVVISILLSLAILTQQRGSGLSAVFGGEGGFHASKRGAEKILAIATVILAFLFIANSFLFILV